MKRGVAAIALSALLASGCSGTDTSQLLVFAASSLTEAFAELEGSFEAGHPGVDVVVSTAGSQVLRLQIEQGAPAHVFASANPEHMQAIVHAGLATEDTPLARGALVVVVPKSNPAGIDSLGDLPRAERIILGTDKAPVGAYARAMLDRAEHAHGHDFRQRVEANVVSLEVNTRLVLAKVELGEADAAIVYRSDASASRKVSVIPIPAVIDVPADYRITILNAAPAPELARAWVEHALSTEGQALLWRHGFLPPRDD